MERGWAEGLRGGGEGRVGAGGGVVPTVGVVDVGGCVGG